MSKPAHNGTLSKPMKTSFKPISLSLSICQAIVAVSLSLLATNAVYAADNTVTELHYEATTNEYQLSAGTLELVLNQLGREAGLLLAFPTSLTQGLQSSGLSGSFTAKQALEQLLEGTNIVAVSNGHNSYILQSKTDSGLTLPTLSVVGKAITSTNQLADTYAGGLVAKGGRLGILGQQDVADVPFNVVGYTAKLIENQQAATIADVLDNDASVQRGFGYGNYAEKFTVRGFALDGDDISFGGLYGVLPRQVVATNLAERVELFKGSNAFLNGVSPGGSGVGGAINLEPKRAGDEPLTRVSLDYSADSQVGISADISRRFGNDEQFGVRVNLLNREGDTAIDNEDRETKLLAVALDYQGDQFSSSVDIGYMKQNISGGRSVVYTGGALTAIPKAPEADVNYAPSWAGTSMENTFAMLRADYDVTNNWNIYGAIGVNKTREFGVYASPTVNDIEGNSTVYRISVPYEAESFSSLFGVKGQFNTASVSHQLNLAYSGFYQRVNTAYDFSSWPGDSTNIYNPTDVAYPARDSGGGDMNNPNVRSRNKMAGVSLSDSIGFLDDKLLLTLGVRYQDVTVNSYSYAGEIETRYKEHAISPVYGLVIKPWQHISLYANHIEALQTGPSAPSSAVNSGEVFSPYKSKQNEIGIKVDYDTIGASLAVFEISKPEGYTNLSNEYGIYGEQRNRGLELSVYGQPSDNVRLNASASWLNPELTDTENGTNDGNDAVGVPEYRMVLGGEWDIPQVNSLTVLGKLIHNGSQFSDAANTLELSSWTRVDLGLKYTASVGQQAVVLRANVNNVFDKNYWSSAMGGYLTQGSPREVKLSISTDF